MVLVPKAKRSVIAAAIALVVAGVSAGPGWAQPNCPQPRGREVQPPGLPSSLMLVNMAKAAKPADLASHRPSLLTANAECARKDNQERFGKNIDLQACIADSARLLASLDRSFVQFEQADCAYTNVTRLSKNADTTASAWEGKALNFEAWGQPGAALNAWREAYSKAATPLRTRSLAKALSSVGTQAAAAEANDLYGKLGLLGQASYSPEDLVILRDWALLRSGPLQNPRGAIEVWGRLDTAESHSEVGKFYFNSNDEGAAKSAFERVIQLKNEDGASARVSEASYLLGILAARKARTPLAWNEVYKYARDAGASDPRHKRLTCLSLVASGEKTVLSSTIESDVCQLGISPTAEDYLVRGAYLLRRMQFLTCEGKPPAELRVCNSTFRDRFINLANEAEIAFADGQRRLPVTSPQTPPPAFDWLMLSVSLPLTDLLKTGETLADSVTQGNLGCRKLRLPISGSREYEFFERLDLLSCEYRQFF
jgi:tetratricopeptide (TPR) repeat protein